VIAAGERAFFLPASLISLSVGVDPGAGRTGRHEISTARSGIISHYGIFAETRFDFSISH
jgi:hypothetical protein